MPALRCDVRQRKRDVRVLENVRIRNLYPQIWIVDDALAKERDIHIDLSRRVAIARAASSQAGFRRPENFVLERLRIEISNDLDSGIEKPRHRPLGNRIGGEDARCRYHANRLEKYLDRERKIPLRLDVRSQ